MLGDGDGRTQPQGKDNIHKPSRRTIFIPYLVDLVHSASAAELWNSMHALLNQPLHWMIVG